MLSNYHTLSYISSLLGSRLSENAVIEAFSQERDELVFRFSAEGNALIISCDKGTNTLYLRPDFVRARSNSADVLSDCVDQTIDAVEMHPVDRVVLFRLRSGKRVDARMFGTKSNVVLVDQAGIVLDAFKNAKSEVGTRADYRTGEIVYDIDALRARLAGRELATIATVLKEEFPTLGATVAKEVLHRAHVPHSLGMLSISGEHLEAIQRALTTVLHDLSQPLARVYLFDEGERKGTPAAFSIIPLSHLSVLKEEQFDDVFRAIRFFVARQRHRDSFEERKQSLRGKIHQKLTRAKRTLEAVEKDLAGSNRAEEYQRIGDFLMSNVHRIPAGEVKVIMDADDRAVEIELAKDLTTARNAQRYFEKAKRSRAARQQATERLVELQKGIGPAERLLGLLDKVDSKEEWKRFMTENEEDLEELGLGEKGERRQQLPFRIFIVDGGFEVWAGKSSKNNDQLTLKYAKPNDLWFHARGSAGSHVVLKVNTGKGEPGKKAKEQAAGIAAYYSKMKNAKMVPVAMTEKKYVRKPKGSAPGSVTVEREKVIFAEPGLPRENVQ